MWLFTRYGFYSVTVSVQDRTKMQVRARASKDLENLLNVADEYGIRLHVKNGGVIETKNSDYRYRLIINREEWPALAHALAGDVDYSNFKGQIKDNTRHSLYEDVWRTMLSLQYQAERHNWLPVQRGFFEDLMEDNLPGLPNELVDDEEYWDEFTGGKPESADPTDPFYFSDKFTGLDLDD